MDAIHAEQGATVQEGACRVRLAIQKATVQQRQGPAHCVAHAQQGLAMRYLHVQPQLTGNVLDAVHVHLGVTRQPPVQPHATEGVLHVALFVR